MSATQPSGAQYPISFGDQEAVVVEVGGGLRTYTAGGVDVLEGYEVDEMASAGRGQLLLPWPNRIRDGRYRFAGEELQLALTEPARHNASHGLVRWVNWRTVAHEADRVVVELVLHPQPGYPFTLGLSVEYRLGDGGLAVATTATNLGDRPCPYGAGAHPYLTVGTPTVDPVVLLVPAATRLVTDERAIPVERVGVAGSGYDFRQPRAVGDLALDTAFTDLGGDSVVVAGPDRRVALWWDDSYRWVMVFTGDGLPAERRRTGLAVEPMTCPPNAFVTGEDVKVLEPGEAWTTRWGIRVHTTS
ncbi:MAG TPA: aldose 1-epimerase family protein [Acidimicrobiales bacterium]|nr:aldose 1-epimerase family protein [Acidimicrobiales bacterium]